MSASVRVYFKKEIRLDRLSFQQQDMLKLGTVATAAVKNRVRAAQGPNDGPAKPLAVGYAKFKSRRGLKNRRDLWGTGFALSGQLTRAKKRPKVGKRFIGHMLDDLRVRTVTGDTVRIGLSQFAARAKGLANQLREPWLVLSPSNRAAVNNAWGLIFAEKVKRLARVVSVSLGKAA